MNDDYVSEMLKQILKTVDEIKADNKSSHAVFYKDIADLKLVTGKHEPVISKIETHLSDHGTPESYINSKIAGMAFWIISIIITILITNTIGGLR